MKSPGRMSVRSPSTARVRAVALQHEAQRRLRVAVGGRHLVRDDELHAGIERGGDLRLPAQAGVLQHQHAPLGLLGGDQLARLQHGRADGIEAPQRRHAGALGLGRDQRAQHRPQRRHVLLVDAVVEGLDARASRRACPWRLAGWRFLAPAFSGVTARKCEAHAPTHGRAAKSEAASAQWAAPFARYCAEALRRRVARSKWKWSRCASLASGPSTVPNTPHAPLCSRRRKSASALFLAVLGSRPDGHGSGLGVGADVGYALVLPLEGRCLAPRSGLLFLGLGAAPPTSVAMALIFLSTGPDLGRLGLGRRLGLAGFPPCRPWLRWQRPARPRADVARRRAPAAHHVDGAAVGRDESGDVDGVGERMLAQPVGAERVAVARAAGVARGVAQPRRRACPSASRAAGCRVFSTQACRPDHHGAVEHRRRVDLDLAGARADALQQHRGRRAALSWLDGLGDLDVGGDRRQQPHAFPQARRSSRRRTRPRAWAARRRPRLVLGAWLGAGGSGVAADAASLVLAPRPPAARLPG